MMSVETKNNYDGVGMWHQRSLFTVLLTASDTMDSSCSFCCCVDPRPCLVFFVTNLSSSIVPNVVLIIMSLSSLSPSDLSMCSIYQDWIQVICTMRIRVATDPVAPRVGTGHGLQTIWPVGSRRIENIELFKIS